MKIKRQENERYRKFDAQGNIQKSMQGFKVRPKQVTVEWHNYKLVVKQ